MLKAGGIYDQPAPQWLACRQAGAVWQFCEKINAAGFMFSSMTSPERALHKQYKMVDIDTTEPDD